MRSLLRKGGPVRYIAILGLKEVLLQHHDTARGGRETLRVWSSG